MPDQVCSPILLAVQRIREATFYWHFETLILHCARVAEAENFLIESTSQTTCSWIIFISSFPWQFCVTNESEQKIANKTAPIRNNFLLNLANFTKLQRVYHSSELWKLCELKMIHSRFITCNENAKQRLNHVSGCKLQNFVILFQSITPKTFIFTTSSMHSVTTWCEQ